MSDKKQADLEAEMVDMGKARYAHKVKRSKEVSLETTTGVGQRLLSESVDKMTESLKLWLASAKRAPGRRHKAYAYINELNPKIAAMLTCKCVLDCISIERKITSTAMVVGRTLEDEVRFRELKKEYPSLWRQINKSLDRFKSQKTKSKFINNTVTYHDIVLPKWPRKDAASVGLTCIELMKQATGIIDIVTRRDLRGKSFTYIRPTEELLAWLKNSHEFNESLSPVWMPMIERPLDWNNPFIGGYRADTFRRRPLVKTHDSSYLDDIAGFEMPEVYNAINTLQRTGFRVDSQVHSLLKHCWERGLPIGGIPSMEDDPVPPKPGDIKTDKESRRTWRKAAAKVHFENERQKSKRLQVMKVLHLADKFEGRRIWFPQSLDFRARTYPVPYFLQPQGPPWVKSLLRFSEGKKINDHGVEWLYIHAANKWGMDKERYKERIRWAEENKDLIRQIGEDPLSNMTWTDAEDPWGFVAVCGEISALHREGMDFVSTLPVSMDATNQGLQLYSLLLKDSNAAAATNVLPQDVPSDVYKTVADLVRKSLYEDTHEYGNKWLDFGIDRTTTKRQTMTLCYGSTFYSCRTYTCDWFYEAVKAGRASPFDEADYHPCNYLAEKIWNSIGEVVSSARVAMDWLRSVASILIENDVTPRWMTPLGFPVKMRYENTDKYAVKTLVGGVLRQHRLRLPNGDRNNRKTVNAICPNFVHSLDGIGGLLGATVNLASLNGVKSIQSIHDSISVLPTDAPIMASCVREVTAQMFEDDLLLNLANQLEIYLPTNVSLPEPPKRGDLDVSSVRKSLYYFN